ncbi:MAG: hypothetical protein LBO74_15550 [Candidatus Symbiothrix sp.]|jgi:hypothetical protein|nr:hypothetical protein [Candidatus Symbiothrix sp.]
MEMNLNAKLAKTILEKISKSVKPVAFLMEILQISRESAYRRIRGEIPFSVDELALLSRELKFSIDEIVVDNKSNHTFFDLSLIKTSGSSNEFSSLLQRYYTHLKSMLEKNPEQTIVALNRVPPVFRVSFNTIFKFTYYEWLQHNSEISSDQHFSTVFVTPEIMAWQEKIRSVLLQFNHTTMIWDPNVFLSLIKDIQYYYQRKLMSEEDVDLLKKEITAMIDLSEKTAKIGSLGNSKVHVYLSPLFINASTSYVRFDHTVKTFIWVFIANPIIVNNPEVCSLQKRWLYSLRRQSTLISQSNEIQQAEFFDRQREYLDQL